jgi:PAS domain S-box-containing protein
MLCFTLGKMLGQLCEDGRCRDCRFSFCRNDACYNRPRLSPKEVKLERHTDALSQDDDEGLLSSVLADTEVKERLQRMPADEKTVTICSLAGTGFTHPSWPQSWEDYAVTETMELVSEPAEPSSSQVDKGFVPVRLLSQLTEMRAEEVDYRIVGKLGSGGTGVVYQAHQRALDREVAIKVLRDELARHEVSRERFLTEARVIGGLDHPNVIALHEVCVDSDGFLFYSMKRIEGASWDQQIAANSVDENVKVLLRVADAIRYAHSRGLVHRDIKPENIMLGQFGEVLVADWGLALRIEGNDQRQGGKQTIGGTPAYMAPELADGSHNAAKVQTDVYLLGAILFEILTGYPPHDGKSLLACLQAAARNAIRDTDVTGELMDIARVAMADRIEDRYPSVDAFIAALNDQQKHDQSVRLVKRAQVRLLNAKEDHQYEDFRVADALLMEALDIWPENTAARETRADLQEKFAEAATRRGDYDLALSIYASAERLGSQQAMEVAALKAARATNDQRNSRYSVLFTQAPEAGLLIRMEGGCVVEANDAFRELFGYSNQDLENKSIFELNIWDSEEDRERLTEALQNTGALNNLESRFLHRDGHAIDVLISGCVVDMQGEAMVVSTIRDISIRKKAEKELMMSRQRLSDLQRLAGLATWSFDTRTEELVWSDEAYRLSGRDPDLGPPSSEEFYSMIHEEDREMLRDTIDAALASGLAYELTVRQVLDDGECRDVLLKGQPIYDVEGYTIELYGVMIPQST